MYICTYFIQIKIYLIGLGKGITNCMTEVSRKGKQLFLGHHNNCKFLRANCLFIYFVLI